MLAPVLNGSSRTRVNGSATEAKPIDPDSSFIVVADGEVVHGCDSAEEAVEFTDRQPGAVYGRLSESPAGKRRGQVPESNPVAHAIHCLSRDQDNRARALIDNAICGYVDEFHNSGLQDLARPDKSTGRDKRRATNAECALLSIRIKLFGSIDLRRNIFEQLSKCVRNHAKRFEALAEKLTGMDDTRDLDLIAQCVNDKKFLEKLSRDGKRIGLSGKIEPSFDSNEEREVAEHLHAAFGDRFDEFRNCVPSFLHPRFFGVVNPGSIQNPTQSLASAVGFARGLGAQSIVVGMVDAVEGGAA